MTIMHVNDTDRERQLFAAILLRVIMDLCPPNEKKRTNGGPVIRRWPTPECVDAERWIGDFPTRNFKEICFHAGLDPDAAWKRLKEITRLEPEKRRAILQRMHREDDNRDRHA